MWRLVLVFVFEDPSWPADQPAPTLEIVRDVASFEKCETERDWWLANGEAEPQGFDPRWANLLVSCEPVNANTA